MTERVKAYPDWCCWDCGTKASGVKGHRGGVATYHDGTCEVCGKKKAVTQPRDFGYPKFARKALQKGGE